jgi:hypothetical protein
MTSPDRTERRQTVKKESKVEERQEVREEILKRKKERKGGQRCSSR